MATYQLNINGQKKEVTVDPSTPLLWVLREDLKMTGTKFGCGISACGACTVHVGGIATRSCIVPVSHVGDRPIVTIEGIGQDAVGKAVQNAWVDIDVVQCGYCQSGQIMSAVALLKHTSKPTDKNIDESMGGNICRCGTYPRIREAIKTLTIVDGTVLRAVNRMAWAPAAGFGSALRLHLHFSVYDQVPTDWSITPGNASEAKEWKKKTKSDDFYVVDRLYGQDLLHLKQLQKRGVNFVVRLCEHVVRTPVGPNRALSPADRKAGVVSDRLEELGLLGGGPSLRLVELQCEGKTFLLATTRQDLPAEMIGLIYRYRWQVELFFKWLKTMLPCEHWLAESPRGATLQIYSLLIAALLLFLWTGRRPTKRQMEALWFYWSGLADPDELAQALKNSR